MGSILWIGDVALVGMLALWIAAYFSVVRRSAVGSQLTFLLGVFLAWPALTVGIAAAMYEVFDSDVQQNPVGLAVVMPLLIAAPAALLMWLVGYWAAKGVGWLVIRNFHDKEKWQA